MRIYSTGVFSRAAFGESENGEVQVWSPKGQVRDRVVSKKLPAATIAIFVIVVAGGYMFYLSIQPRGTYFVVDVLGERFTMYVLDKETIQLATDQMNGLNHMHPIADLDSGDGGFNKPWSWHMKPETVKMTDFSTELCDAKPHMLQDNLTYWIKIVGYYCPWSARIVSATPTVPQNLTVQIQLVLPVMHTLIWARRQSHTTGNIFHKVTHEISVAQSLKVTRPVLTEDDQIGGCE